MSADELRDAIQRINSGDNNSTQKLLIELVEKPGGGHWIDAVLVRYRALPRFRPAFRDLYRIIQALALCEDDAYPPPTFLGRRHLGAFLIECAKDVEWGYLATKYKIPERDGDDIVNTNGADLQRKARRLNPDLDDRWIVAQDEARQQRRR